MTSRLFRLVPFSRFLVSLAEGWTFAGQDHRYPAHCWLAISSEESDRGDAVTSTSALAPSERNSPDDFQEFYTTKR